MIGENETQVLTDYQVSEFRLNSSGSQTNPFFKKIINPSIKHTLNRINHGLILSLLPKLSMTK